MPPHSNMVDSYPIAVHDDCCHSVMNYDIKQASVTGPLHQQTTRKSPSSEQQKTKKSVQFSAYDEVLEIPNTDDMSNDEIDSVWYTSNELTLIRDECIQILELLDITPNNTFEETDTFTLRGLESQTEKCHINKCHVRDTLYDIIWKFQEIQKQQGIIYPDTILAGLVQSHTMQSQQEAEIVGLCDAIAMHRC